MMALGARRLFIYYRVTVVDAAVCRAEAAQLQRRLAAAHPGLVAELLQRPDTGAQALATLMESYAVDAAAAPDGVDVALQASIEAEGAAALGARTIGERHTEVFVACA
jgi:uncharacterized iron-regulated membrane protein